MQISVRPAAALSIAAKLVDDILYKRDLFYLFFGKLESWPNEISPIEPSVSEKDDRDIRASTFFYKRVMPGDTSLVTKRVDWTSGATYDQWDDFHDMRTKNFFVMNSEFRVYKCLDNNIAGPSTIEPRGTQFVPLILSDGYIWKYMYTVPAAKRKRFLSVDTLPVQRAFTDSFYNNGSIERVDISRQGAGYSGAQATALVVANTVAGSGATATISTVDGLGAVTGVTVSAGGTLYPGSCNVTVTTGTGSGAVFEAVVVAGVVTGITIVSPGAGYTAATPLTITTGGAKLIPIINSLGEIDDVYIENSGAGYSGEPVITITGPAGTGKYPGNTTAIIRPVMFNGRIDRIMIEDPGVDYVSGLLTTIAVVGDGSGAIMIPVIDTAGSIVDVYIENPGLNYTSATVVVSGTNTTPAALSAVIASYDMTTDQSIVEQSAIDGAIHLIKVVAGGEGYTLDTQVTIVGDGINATAFPVIVNGVITKIDMGVVGSGYTWATVSIVDPNRLDVDPEELLPVATVRAVISPDGGHGKNAPVELLASTAAISVSMRDVDALNLIGQEFRQYGLIRNLRRLNTNEREESLSTYEAYVSVFTSVAGLNKDDLLYSTNASYRVVYIEGMNVHLVALGKNDASPVGTLTGPTGAIYECLSISTSPVVNKYSGDMYFVSNEMPFVVDEQQGIILRSYLTF